MARVRYIIKKIVLCSVIWTEPNSRSLAEQFCRTKCSVGHYCIVENLESSHYASVVRAQIDGRGRVTLSHLLQRKVDYIFVATTELCLDRVGFFPLWNWICLFFICFKECITYCEILLMPFFNGQSKYVGVAKGQFPWDKMLKVNKN